MPDQIAELESRLDKAQSEIEKIDALNDLAWELRNYDSDRAQALSEQARELAVSGSFAAKNYLIGVAASLSVQSSINSRHGDYGLALSQAFEALEYLKKAGKHVVEIDVLLTIGWCFHGFGDYAVALEYEMKALALAQELGDKKREIRVLGNVASSYAETGNLEEAIRIEQVCMEFHRQSGQKEGESISLNNLAMSYLKNGDHAKALEAGLAGLKAAQENKISLAILVALSTVGEIYLTMKDYTEALAYLQQGISLAQEVNATYDQCYILFYLGKIHYQQGDIEHTLACLHQSLGIAAETQNRFGQVQSHELLAEVYEKQGSLAEALAHWKQFHFIKETIFNENSAKRIANLQVLHQVENAKRDAEIYYWRNEELLCEIEERKKAEKALEELATTDPLTGLFNRRHFFKIAELLLNQSVRYHDPLSLMILDIDNFKQVNDNYGHASGDEAIKLLASAIQLMIRKTDVAARFGGDEFVILMPETLVENAKILAERLKLYLSENAIPVGKVNLHFTISIGIASASDEVGSIDKILEHADQMLYAAKQAGRNQIKVFGK